MQKIKTLFLSLTFLSLIFSGPSFVFFSLAFSGLMVPQSLRAEQPLSTQQKKAIEKIIHDYLIDNPETLANALDNVQAHFQARDRNHAEKALIDNADRLYHDKRDFTLGRETAPITIVEFFDYNCGFCKRVFPTLMEAMRDNNDVRLVFKEYPILSPSSIKAARAALAIKDNLKFLTFHTKLMNNRGGLNEAFIAKTLKDIGLSADEIIKRAEAPEISKLIERNEKLAQDLKLSGTPVFIINGVVYPGAISKQEFSEAIAKARNKLAQKTR